MIHSDQLCVNEPSSHHFLVGGDTVCVVTVCVVTVCVVTVCVVTVCVVLQAWRRSTLPLRWSTFGTRGLGWFALRWTFSMFSVIYQMFWQRAATWSCLPFFQIVSVYNTSEVYWSTFKVSELVFVWSANTLRTKCSCFQDQFEFALTAVAEEVNAILKALPQ